MERLQKGSSINHYIKDYCVVDLETTGVFISSVRIIEISAIRVREEKVVAEFSSLVNPKCHIPSAATAVNNITDEMVKNAPVLNMIIDDFLAFISNDVIIGYNNAGFDMNLIYDQLMDLRGIQFTNDYIDILHSARRCLSDVDNYKLETISKYYHLDTIGEHRALKDCYLTKACYENLYRDYGSIMFARSAKSSGGHRTTHYSVETLALQELQNLLETIIDDGKVTITEFYALKNWMEEHRDLQGNYPFDRVFRALDKVLEDGKVTPEELEELQILFTDFVDPVQSRCCKDDICSLYGKHICVTGDFEYGSRNDVFALIEETGAIVDKNVKKATDYLVVGALGSENWKTGNYGGKIQKAMEWSDKGSEIIIVEEHDFISAAKRIIQEGVVQGDLVSEKQTIEDDWKQRIREMLIQLVREYELPEGSLYLSDNKGKKDNTKIISYSVCIWEPDYPLNPKEKPGKNKIVVTIVPSTVKGRPDDLDLSLREDQEGDLRRFLPKDAELIEQAKADKDARMVRVRFKKSSETLTDYIRKNTEYCIKGYNSKAARFGCCSSFEKCSDAKKCLHENKLYSMACMYRAHLEEGRIFYGKNRNID